MEEREFYNKFEKILRDKLEPPSSQQITPDTSFRGDLNMDSLDSYELLYETEEQFKLRIIESDERLIDIDTMKEAYTFLRDNYQL
jgi:acyl carrier protein